LDPQDFGFLDPDPDPKKYADPRIRIQGVKYKPKTAKNIFLLGSAGSQNLADPTDPDPKHWLKYRLKQ